MPRWRRSICISLALGVTIVSLKGTNIDLLHVLFGIGAGARRSDAAADRRRSRRVTLVVLALIYRPLVLECVDPGFPALGQPRRRPGAFAFLALVVINLVGGFHALGTLLAVGIMMLPAATARFWARDITAMIADRGRQRRDLRLCRAAALVPRRRAVRARRSSWWPARSTWSRCCSAASAAWCGSSFRGRHLEA